MSDKMKNLVTRTLSGVVLTAVTMGAILLSKWSFGALLLLILLLGQGEFYRMARATGAAPLRLSGLTAGVVLFVLSFVLFVSPAPDAATLRSVEVLAVCFLLALALCFVCRVFRAEDAPIADLGATVLGVVYVALPLALLLHVPVLAAGGEWNPWVMLFFVFIIWANDVFAYLVGMTFGRHRLCERLSPKKSWEGFFGGVAGAVIVGFVAARVVGGDVWAWCGLALVSAVTGVLGDLTESMFKRSAGVKDSGNVIPGHGGVLDRFDALLLAAPFAFGYLLLTGGLF